MNADQRAELRQEYYHLASYVQGYDAHFLLIKSWGITVSGAAIGVGFSTDMTGTNRQIGLFLIALVLSLAFWITEVELQTHFSSHTFTGSHSLRLRCGRARTSRRRQSSNHMAKAWHSTERASDGGRSCRGRT